MLTMTRRVVEDYFGSFATICLKDGREMSGVIEHAVQDETTILLVVSDYEKLLFELSEIEYIDIHEPGDA